MRPVVSLGAIVVVITLFLWLGADVFFGQFAPTASKIILMYLILLVSIGFVFRAEMPVITLHPKNLIYFSISVGTILVVGIFPSVFFSSFEPLTFISFGFLYAFVKAFIEEVIFRWVLPVTVGLGAIVSSILFGAFHFGVLMITGAPLQTVIIAMIFLSILGYVWCRMRDVVGKNNPNGLMVTTGSHFGYNLIALGVF